MSCLVSVFAMPTILMLTGLIGVGKSQAASFLRETGFQEYTFAGPLKQIGSALGFADDELYGSQEQKLAVNPFWGVSGRQFLQVFGSEVCRDFLPKVLPQMFKDDQTLWCRLAEKFVQETQARNPNASVVFSDGRFPDEADFVHRVGGAVVRIERPAAAPANSATGGVSAHQSEQGASSIKADYIVVNDGHLLQLQTAINLVVERVRAGVPDTPETIVASKLDYDRALLLMRWKDVIRTGFYALFECPFCSCGCGWFYDNCGDLLYSCGCNCSSDPTPPRLSDDEHLLRYIDGQAARIQSEWSVL